jgi:hypothetical protein
MLARPAQIARRASVSHLVVFVFQNIAWLFQKSEA